jgi:alkylation response protein AidB-like acyl-CoA dehydrogenase
LRGAEGLLRHGGRIDSLPCTEIIMSFRPTLDFLLYDWLDAEGLARRERFSDHSRETFDAVLDTCERIAREKYAPHNRTVDAQEPRFDGERVILPQATHDAHAAFAASGMLSAAQDYDIGGMQLPYTVQAAANAFFAMASVSIGSGLLTSGNANLLMVHGTPMQREVFARNEFSGRWSGTMNSEIPRVPGTRRPSASGILASTMWTMFSVSSWSPEEIHILLPVSR